MAIGCGLKSNTNIFSARHGDHRTAYGSHSLVATSYGLWKSLLVKLGHSHPSLLHWAEARCSSLRSAQHTMGEWEGAHCYRPSAPISRAQHRSVASRNVGSSAQHVIKMGNVWTIYFPSCLWFLFSGNLMILRPYCFVCFIRGGQAQFGKYQ